MKKNSLPYWVVNYRQRCDLEMLLVGAFKPINGFLSKNDYDSVLSDMHTTANELWPMPITLDVTEEFAQSISLGDAINLYDFDNTILARMIVTDKWCPDKGFEAQQVFATQDSKHPGVDYLFNKAGAWYLGGPVHIISQPKHYDFTELRHTPDELKQKFTELGWTKIIGFQTRNPIHQAHKELMQRATEQISGSLLIHPVVGLTKSGDVDHSTRVHCYKKIVDHFPKQTTLLSLLNLAMRMAGPREALWHALIRKNYGCTHFIVGRDHAGPGLDKHNNPFYEPDAAQKLALAYEKEIGITILSYPEMVYVQHRKTFAFINEITTEETTLSISGTALRDKLRTNQEIPAWFSFPEIINELRKAHPPKHKQGFTVFITGLSGSGKSTLAQALLVQLSSHYQRSASIIDGDVVRRLLGGRLGFSKEDRNINISLISYIASEITKAGGIALCPVIAPYEQERQNARSLISHYGGYIEIYNATPLSVCEQRDPKGLYAKARAGIVKSLTGIDDVYEQPKLPELIIDTSNSSIEQSVDQIIKFLYDRGYILNPFQTFAMV